MKDNIIITIVLLKESISFESSLNESAKKKDTNLRRSVWLKDKIYKCPLVLKESISFESSSRIERV